MTARKPNLLDTPVVTTTGSSTIHILGQELDPSLVQRQGMPEITNMFTGSRRARQRGAPADANRRYSVPETAKIEHMSRQSDPRKDSPHPDEMDMNVGSTERLLKRFRQYGILGLLLGLFRKRLADNTGGSCQTQIIIVRF